jgi:prenyltransferase beta subunit
VDSKKNPQAVKLLKIQARLDLQAKEAYVAYEVFWAVLTPLARGDVVLTRVQAIKVKEARRKVEEFVTKGDVVEAKNSTDNDIKNTAKAMDLLVMLARLIELRVDREALFAVWVAYVKNCSGKYTFYDFAKAEADGVEEAKRLEVAEGARDDADKEWSKMKKGASKKSLEIAKAAFVQAAVDKGGNKELAEGLFCNWI